MSSAISGTGRVWKVATNGPTATDCVEQSAVAISNPCLDGAVSAGGYGYWALEDLKVAKTKGGATGDNITLLGEYTIPGGSGDAFSIRLDEVNQILYVGGSLSVYKLTSGGDTDNLPVFQNKFDLIADDGETISGLAVDPSTGYGKLQNKSHPFLPLYVPELRRKVP